MLYLPSCKPVTVDLGKLSGSRIQATWYDPRTGRSRPVSIVRGGGEQEFIPPQVWPDWVLVLDDAERGYPAPGT